MLSILTCLFYVSSLMGSQRFVKIYVTIHLKRYMPTINGFVQIPSHDEKFPKSPQDIDLESAGQKLLASLPNLNKVNNKILYYCTVQLDVRQCSILVFCIFCYSRDFFSCVPLFYCPCKRYFFLGGTSPRGAEPSTINREYPQNFELNFPLKHTIIRLTINQSFSQYRIFFSKINILLFFQNQEAFYGRKCILLQF